MSIAKTVEQALRDGYLTPAMEAEVYRMCANASELLIEEYMALDRLMGALLIGEVVARPRKQFINVMEKLVRMEAIARVAEIEATSESSLDVGNIAAYALNRLPPLYATREEGVNFQRKTAQAQLQELIYQQVSEAINRCLDRPNLFLERQALGENTDNEIVRQVSALLQAYDNLLIQRFDELRSLISRSGVDRVCAQFVFFLLEIRQNKLDCPYLAWIKKMIITAMSIAKIVEQALQDGYLTPVMEAEVGRICDNASELSIEEYMALDRLMGALLTGEVVAIPRKQFINVMEELVLMEAIARVAEIEATSESSLDVGDIAAYALNRLPPLYATTEEGASFQRETAQAQLQELISQQVNEALVRYLDRPNFFPERQALSKNTGNEVERQLTALLKTYAPKFEQNDNHP